MEHATVLQELLAVVGGEDDEGLSAEPQEGQSLDEPAQLGVHLPDGPVVPVPLVGHVGLRVDLRLDQLVPVGHPEEAQQRIR